VLQIFDGTAGEVFGNFEFEFIPIDADPISCFSVDGPPLAERCESPLVGTN